MMRKDNELLGFLLILAVIVFTFNVFRGYILNETSEVVKTDTVFSTKTDTLWKDTTIVEKEFVPKYIIKQKTDTLFKANGDTVELVTESKRFDKTLISDKDTAEVEIYTSGIETSLDSLKMRLKTHTETVTNTVEITKYIERPKKLWNRIHIQPQVTSGYDLINKQWGITCGIGVGIEI